MLTHIRKVLPLRTRRASPDERRAAKAPSMIWGYTDATGSFRERTRISDTALLYHPEKIVIGDNVFVGHYNILDGVGGITIGEGCQFAAYVGIFTHSSHIAIRLYGDHYQEVPEDEKKGYRLAPVRLGRYVYVGAGARVFSGVSIGDGAVLYAGAYVSADVEPFQIVAGNPARPIGDARDLDRPYLDDPQILEWYEEWQRK